MAQIPLEHINAAAQDYFQERLNKVLELAIKLPRDSSIDLDFEIQGSVERIDALKIMQKKQQYDTIVEIDAREILDKISNETHTEEALIYMRKLVARAMVLQNEYLVAELSGGVYGGAPQDPLFKNISPGKLPYEEDTASANSLSLSAAIDTYIVFKDTIWAKKTKGDQTRCLNLACEVIGAERPLSSVNTNDIRAIRDILMRMPANAFKTRNASGKTLTEICNDLKDSEKLSHKTRDKYFTMIRSFFKWAKDEELITDIPGPNIKLTSSLKEDAKERRSSFSEDELLKIFTSPLYSGYKSHARRHLKGNITDRDDYYWIPIVALYSGMRLGEIVQLRISDIKTEDEIPFFDISLDDEGDKTVKTITSIRRTPLHPTLIDLGLLSYLENRVKKKKKRLFDDIQPSIDGYYSANFSKWWGRYMRKIGVKTKKIVFHSFRHSFIDALKEAEVADDVSRQLTGHNDQHSTNDSHSHYGNKATLKRLRAAIDKVNYGEVDQILLKT